MSGISKQRRIFALLVVVSCVTCMGCKEDRIGVEQAEKGSGPQKNAAVAVNDRDVEEKNKSEISPSALKSSAGTTGLKVKEMTPEPGKNDAVVNDPIAVVFSEAVDAESAEGAFSVTSDKGEQIAGRTICKDDTVIFKADKDLEYGEHYKVKLSKRITGTSGNRIAKDVVWDFLTNQAIMARLRVKNGDSIILSDITGYDFYDQEIKASTLPVPFTLRNEGNANLVIKSIAFSSGDAGQFTLTTPTLPVTLAPEKEIRISVVFTPQSAGKKTAVLKIKSNDGVMGFFHLLMTGKGI